MNSFILTYIGDSAELESNLAALQSRHCAWLITKKLATVFELQCEGDLLAVAAQMKSAELAVWELRNMTYADTSPPGISLQGLQKHLTRVRKERDARDWEG